MKLDKVTLATLTLPPGKSEFRYFDERLPGHGIRLRHATDQSKWRWITQSDVNGKSTTITHGPPTLIEPGAAFKRSKDLLASVRLGGDPAAAKREARAKAAETFGAILPRYLKKAQSERRPRSFKEVERHLVKYAKPLHSRAVNGIDNRVLSGLVGTVADNNGPSAAIECHGSLSGYFMWLRREGLIDRNPMPDTNKPKVRPAREYVPTEDELRTLWAALGDDDYSDILRLVIYGGNRRAEIGGLRWDEVVLNEALLDIPGARMKGGKPHLVPLSEPALAILQKRARDRKDGDHVFGRGPHGFQGWSWAREDLNSRIAGPRPTWVLHDYRRLTSTVMHEKLGIAPHVVERVLAHVGHQAGIAGKYNKAQYLIEKRRALVLWADFIGAVTEGRTTNIVAMSPRAVS